MSQTLSWLADCQSVAGWFIKGLEKEYGAGENLSMGYFSKKLLEGERNECIDYYLSEIPDRYLAAVRAGFPALPKTLVNIHVEMAARYFDKLEIRLRYKGSYSQTEIEGNLVHAEAIALATACNQINLDYEECEGILSDTAYDLAASHYNEKLTPRENFSKISGGSDLSGKSRMYRSWVSNAFNFIAQDE